MTMILSRCASTRCRFRRRAGSAAVEFAIVGPLMILMVMSMLVYGGWLWLAMSVQTLATESARAAIGGLDAAEQRRLVAAFIDAEASPAAGVAREHLTLAVDTEPGVIRVRVALDVSDHPLMMISVVTPPPPSTIRRSAVVRTGGY